MGLLLHLQYCADPCQAHAEPGGGGDGSPSASGLTPTLHLGLLQGYEVVPIYIGCPPGKRLAFDITRTLRYTAKKNNRYYDCISINPDMPCFFFDDSKGGLPPQPQSLRGLPPAGPHPGSSP